MAVTSSYHNAAVTSAYHDIAHTHEPVTIYCNAESAKLKTNQAGQWGFIQGNNSDQQSMQQYGQTNQINQVNVHNNQIYMKDNVGNEVV